MGKITNNYKRRDSRTYFIWANVKYRCLTSSCPLYLTYGGRGIKICERWMDFNNFLKDMGERPSGYSLDRIDVNGNYEPSNCRWATSKQQMNNRRNNHILTYKGISLNLTQWSERLNISRTALCKRVYRGWQIEKALTTTVWVK